MLPPDPPHAVPRRPGLADRTLGAIGAAVIRTVLAVARLWARLTGSTWHG